MVLKYNIIVLGASEVGKGSFVKSLSSLYSAKAQKEKKTTISLEVTGNKYEVKTSCFFDTGLTFEEQNEISSADGYIILYDLTNKFSIERARMYFKKVSSMRGSDKFPLVLAGNKADLEEEREIPTQESLKLGDEFKCGVFETSTKKNKGIADCFLEILRVIDKNKRETVIQEQGVDALTRKGTGRGKNLSQLFASVASDEDAATQFEEQRRRMRSKTSASNSYSASPTQNGPLGNVNE